MISGYNKELMEFLNIENLEETEPQTMPHLLKHVAIVNK
jgi:hypothetical protein